MSGVSASTARRGERFWITVAQRAVALVVVAVGILTLWYRQTYNVWPGQEASTRIHWCGRDFQSFPRGAVCRRHRRPADICQPAAGLRDSGLPAYRPGPVSVLQP
jgi:hypothetical protein